MYSVTELGQRLKEARDENGLSLDELQTKTKIQKRYLTAIEQGNYEILPGKFYARAFVKQYAEAVGLDPEALFDQYSSEIPKSTNEEYQTKVVRTRRKKSPTSGKSSKLFSILPKVLITLLIVGILVVIWFFRQSDDGQDQPVNDNNDITAGDEVELGEQDEQDETDVETDPIEEQPVEEEQPEEEVVEEPEEPEQPQQKLTQDPNDPMTFYLENAEQFVVTLEASGDCWIGIKNGKGMSFFSGVMKADDTETFDFSNEQEIQFNVGFTPTLAIKINDQDFTFPTNQQTQKFTIVYQPNTNE